MNSRYTTFFTYCPQMIYPALRVQILKTTQLLGMINQQQYQSSWTKFPEQQYLKNLMGLASRNYHQRMQS